MQLKDIAQKIGAKIMSLKADSSDPNIKGLAPLLSAGPEELSFLTNLRLHEQLLHTKAAAIIVGKFYENCSALQLVHPNPQEAMAKASLLFFSYQHTLHGRSSQSYVADSAKVHSSVTIYPFAFVDSEAEIGEGSVIYPHVFIGAKAKLGKKCTIFPGAVIMSNIEIGDDVIIHANAVIGADGFGFAIGKDSITKIPQVGKVVIESNVEIGSLTNIDRATFDQTIIRQSTKIDSLVHIGHNVEIGEQSILCGQFGVAGSTKIGKRFIAGGQSAVTQGVSLGDGITIGGRCAVSRSLENGGTYLGTPERPAQEWRKETVHLKNLPQLFKRVRELEEVLSRLTKVD